MSEHGSSLSGWKINAGCLRGAISTEWETKGWEKAGGGSTERLSHMLPHVRVS